jgi:catechol 2,3-dioxygenase-like lactoylglutathione lyase family enzyme
MIDHLSITVGNIEKSRGFYDAALAPLGATRIMNMDRPEVRISGYGRDGMPSFWIADTGGGADPLPGHVAFAAGPERCRCLSSGRNRRRGVRQWRAGAAAALPPELLRELRHRSGRQPAGGRVP